MRPFVYPIDDNFILVQDDVRCHTATWVTLDHVDHDGIEVTAWNQFHTFVCVILVVTFVLVFANLGVYDSTKIKIMVTSVVNYPL